MTELQTIFHNSLPFTECLCAIVGMLHFHKLKNTYWKWFVFYLIFITAIELFSMYGLEYYPKIRKYYFGFLIIPMEFIFFYWLYAKKSLQLEKLFRISCILYSAFYILHLFILDTVRWISSMSYTVGVFLLAIMVYLEFIKQIKSDEILSFKTNKMFYINIGVLLFYVGTLPFFAFDRYLFENDRNLWNNYFTLFLFSVNIMYLLFTASFIWGKSKP